MTPKEYILSIVNKLKKYRRAATCGDCGTFAIALHKKLKQKFRKQPIDLIAIVSENDVDGFDLNADDLFDNICAGDPTVAHVAIVVGTGKEAEYFDIEGELTAKKIKQYEKSYDIASHIVRFKLDSDRVITNIRINTNYSRDWPFYWQQIKAALS